MNNKEKLSAIRLMILPWMPFVFCAFLCGMVIYVGIKTGRPDSVYPVFFGFLPMTFFFAATSVNQIRKELQRLSDRIYDLEKQKQ